MKTWEIEGIAPPFLTSALDGGEWLGSRPDRFTPGTHWMGWLCGLTRTDLDAVV
jgi:hypothetical protein